MKYTLLLALLSLSLSAANSQYAYPGQPINFSADLIFFENANTNIGFQDGQGDGKMLAEVFKKQQYCRAEVERFDFDAPFKVVSATLYFSGTNFKNAEKGTISSNSLKPVSSLMSRCAAGTIVIFEDVKVMGPDKLVRSINGSSFRLY